MKIKLNKSQWEMVGRRSGWMKVAQNQAPIRVEFPAKVTIAIAYDDGGINNMDCVADVKFVDGRNQNRELDITGDGRISWDTFEQMIPQQMFSQNQNV